jgi:uncharacterized protein YndB with AHSA1/START domain
MNILKVNPNQVKLNSYRSVLNSYSFKSRKFFQIKGEVNIRTTPEHIWEALTKPQHLTYFNPFIKIHECKGLTDSGYLDSCIYYNGKELQRILVSYEKQKKIRFKIYFKQPKNNSFTTFEIIPKKKSEKTGFRLTIETDAYKNIPRPLWYIIAYFFLIPSYKKYLNSVVYGMMYHCETGKKVHKNQFGFHKRYSTITKL